MTREKLEEIKKLVEEATPGLWVAEKNAALITAMREHALPLVKALEWQSAMTKALSESQERLVKEVKEARADYEAQTDAWLKEHHRYNDAMDEVEKLKAEVERLREVVRQVHGLASGSIVHSVSLHAIRNITKGMVE